MRDRPLTVGVSLKMYFGERETLRWCADVARLARGHDAVAAGRVELFVLPSAPLIAPVRGVLAGTRVHVGAQDLHHTDRGAVTGGTSGALLAELGCRFAEVGHFERRTLFGEDDAVVAAKTTAALRNGLTPVLCVGEPDRVDAPAAAADCVAQARAALAAAPPGPVVLAYEPWWAIGRPEPAPPQHIGAVTGPLRDWIADQPGRAGSRVIYGGSAGPGLLGRLGDQVDGLFLGRFAHDPAALAAILDEAATLAGAAPTGDTGDSAHTAGGAPARTGEPPWPSA
ncbi:triose-phosphate isomerase family protein [Micromonospora haikouensis]|uniref:triose-phosphate isomerase family protein n=1 Tax=Micromonospora haikouensis TaxID=686309 RepID=UPI003D7295BB